MSSLCSINRIVRPARLERRDQRLHLRGLGRVHAGGRLVEQQQPRPQRERAGDLDAAAVGVGEAVGGMVEARRQPVAEQREDLARLGSERRLPRADRRRANSASASSASGPTAANRGRTARSRVWAPISTLSSTLRLAKTRPCWKVRARPSAAIASGAQALDRAGRRTGFARVRRGRGR